MGLLDEAKDLVNSSIRNNNSCEKGSERYSSLDESDRSGGRNQGSGGNMNTDDSRYAKGNSGGGYQQSDGYSKSGSGGTGARNDENENVGLGYEGRDSTRAAQADSYGDSGFERSQGGYGSSGLSGEGNDALSDDFGARGGVSAGGIGESRDSVSSGGYGANAQGDSFSRKNQTGFDNEPSSGRGGY